MKSCQNRARAAKQEKIKSTYARKCLKTNGGDEGGRTPDLCIANAFQTLHLMQCNTI